MTHPTAHSCQFASVQFSRGSSIEPGKPRHPWHWCILIQLGHIYHISPSFPTLGEAEQDFRENGVALVDKIERELAPCYSINRAAGETEHYDLNVVNPGPILTGGEELGVHIIRLCCMEEPDLRYDNKAYPGSMRYECTKCGATTLPHYSANPSNSSEQMARNAWNEKQLI